MIRYHCAHAWLGGPTTTRDVIVEVEGDRIVEVTTGPRPPEAVGLRGITVPGLADVHSHAFHRALRARTQHGPGSFWTWRDQMYRAAAGLDPDRYHRLARATYAEMVLAGVTCVGEFHYVHHRPDGGPYDDVNVMGAALVAAAAEAGVRITLLDTCYLQGGPDRPLEGIQRRFGDVDGDAWAERASARPEAGHARMGAAIHSVRAVPPDQAAIVATWAAQRRAPLHAHLSEQPAENAASLAAYGATPTAVLAAAGALGPRTTAVHATHLGGADIEMLGSTSTGICMCPTTERDLADGIGPARALADAGSPISVGTDSHAVIDVLEEARALELDERLARGERGRWSPEALLGAATYAGHAALGWPDAGRIEPGAIADLVTVGLDTPRLAGADHGQLVAAVVYAATAADITDVVASGRHVVASGRHTGLVDVAAQLDAAVRELMGR
ncbi:MAG: formimidoylglutamate deiminase [Acidimicrobiales bacterium]